MTYDLVIKSGTAVTSTATFPADIAITGEKITAVGQNLHGREEIDASGCYVLPGGVDIHVHMQMPLPSGAVSADSFASGTRAAALGGTTSIVDFVAAEPEESLLTAYAKRRAEADGQVAIDYGLHMTLTPEDIAGGKLDELTAVVSAGMPTFKLYMAYGFRLNDSELLRALQAIKKVGGLPVVHAENWEIITTLIAQHLAAGKTEPRWHPVCRPAKFEAEATRRVIEIAEFVGLPLHIFHVSCPEVVAEIVAARGRGTAVTGETCPQYLYLTQDAYDAPGLAGTLPICAPPLRPLAAQQGLWRALAANHLQIVTTDHCPFNTADKARGLTDFSQIPGGVPSIEMRLAGIYQAVRRGELSLERWVDLCCTTPAKLARLAHKGELIPGYDADIVIFDPHTERTLSPETLHENADWTPYDDLTFTGWPRTTVLRGQVVVRDGVFVGRGHEGRFVAR